MIASTMDEVPEKGIRLYNTFTPSAGLLLYHQSPSLPLLGKWMSMPLLLNNIIAPLTEHPNQTSGRNEYWPSQASAPDGSLEYHPLAHEMKPCDGIGPNCELVELGIGDIVGSVETDDGGDDGPGTEES